MIIRCVKACLNVEFPRGIKECSLYHESNLDQLFLAEVGQDYETDCLSDAVFMSDNRLLLSKAMEEYMSQQGWYALKALGKPLLFVNAGVCPDCYELALDSDLFDAEMPNACSQCSGSGEGMHEGERCWHCHGTGTEPPGES